MASRTSLSGGATASKKAPRIGQKSFSKLVVQNCTMKVRVITARILPQTLALVVLPRWRIPTTSLAVLSIGRGIGNGQDVHIWHKSFGEALIMLDVPTHPSFPMGWLVMFKFAGMLEPETATWIPSTMALTSGGWMQWWMTTRAGVVPNVQLKGVTIIDKINDKFDDTCFIRMKLTLERRIASI